MDGVEVVIKKIIYYVIGFILSAFFMWGFLEVEKRVSYRFWYRDMVRQTVADMVRPEALR